ncbi:MAG: ATP-dependent helicase [Anaerolineaceae bacterium]|nr:ATP-dependent helicase [Anaerolineaceae bacterium]
MHKTALRESQARILEYSSGRMGIAAVPGSGKTWTLSQLAAKLIMTTDLEDDQEILVVTFTNSAAENFSSRIGRLLRERGLIEGFGYRVRTLHGLANDIIHVRPELAGLPNDFAIIDAAESSQILQNEVQRYLSLHPELFKMLVNPSFSEKRLNDLRQKEFPSLMENVAKVWIQQSKNYVKSPADLAFLLNQRGTGSELADYCNAIYGAYQNALNIRGGLDFEDLMALAYRCLKNDPELVALLGKRWPYILEDEAQDSSILQQNILEMLCGEQGNWVRVGDPNQAIYESFTTANPDLLKAFIRSTEVREEDLPESGRSCRAIIGLANDLIDWAGSRHPNMNVRDALSVPHIRPTSPDDPQQNPADRPDSVTIRTQMMTPDEESAYLVKEASAYLKKYPQDTLAVLAMNNQRVSHLAEAFKKFQLPVCEGLMRLSDTVRLSAGAVANILQCIQMPEKAKALSDAFRVVHRKSKDNAELWNAISEAAAWLAKLKFTEDYLYPGENAEWIGDAKAFGLNDEQIYKLEAFRLLVYDWHKAAALPLDQLAQLISLNLELSSTESAAIYRMASFLKSMRQQNPELGNTDLINELVAIAKNNRLFLAFSEDAGGFEPDAHPGEIVIATYHKSKGLEWDKVFMSSCNSYDFPSGDPSENYKQESYFIEGKLNLEAEALEQLDALLANKAFKDFRAGYGTLPARDTLIKERLRVFYVGITRARKSLTLTMNSGKGQNSSALALRQLAAMQKGQP